MANGDEKCPEGWQKFRGAVRYFGNGSGKCYTSFGFLPSTDMQQALNDFVTTAMGPI